jgi:uncharacterized integral membrane protein
MTSDDSQNPNESQHPVASGRNGPNITLIGLAIVTALFIIFFLQNSEKLSIDFLFFEKTTTIRWSLLVAVFLGVAIDRIFTMWWRRRGRRNDQK